MKDCSAAMAARKRRKAARRLQSGENKLNFADNLRKSGFYMESFLENSGMRGEMDAPWGDKREGGRPCGAHGTNRGEKTGGTWYTKRKGHFRRQRCGENGEEAAWQAR